jgi:hypothetical protein
MEIPVRLSGLSGAGGKYFPVSSGVALFFPALGGDDLRDAVRVPLVSPAHI